jgi:hypothetical protein
MEEQNTMTTITMYEARAKAILLLFSRIVIIDMGLIK